MKRASLAAEAVERQLADRAKLQEALKHEQMRLAQSRATASSTQQGEGFQGHDNISSETQGEVKFSRVGCGKLVNVEGPFLLPFLFVWLNIAAPPLPHPPPPIESTVCCHGCGGWLRVSHPTAPGTSSRFTVRLEGLGGVSPFIGAVHEGFNDWQAEKWPHTGSW